MSLSVKTFALSSALILAGAGSAFAGTAAIKSVEVPVKAYEVNNSEGAQVVLDRIEKAAENVCEATRVRRPLHLQTAIRACEASAIETAVKNLDAAYVTEAWEQTQVQ